MGKGDIVAEWRTNTGGQNFNNHVVTTQRSDLKSHDQLITIYFIVWLGEANVCCWLAAKPSKQQQRHISSIFVARLSADFHQEAELSHSQWEKITSAVDWLTGAVSCDPQASASLCLDICRVRGRPLRISTSLFYCQTSWFDEEFLNYSGLILELELNFVQSLGSWKAGWPKDMWSITDSQTEEVYQEESRSSSTAKSKSAAERIQSTYRRSSGRSMIVRFLLRLYRTEKNNRSDLELWHSEFLLEFKKTRFLLKVLTEQCPYKRDVYGIPGYSFLFHSLTYIVILKH